MSVFQKLSRHYPKIPGYRLIRPRRCQVFGIGSPKTGTHSLAAMFAKHFRARHEAEVNREIAILVRKMNGECKTGEVGRWFIERSHRLWLECDVSHLHGFFVQEISEALPEAKFILTLREPYSWLDSSFNQTLKVPLNKHWAIIKKQIHGPLPTTYPEQEAILKQHGLYPIASYLNRWADRIEQVTKIVPQARLLILKTGELKRSAGHIADFCGINARLLSAERSHEHATTKKIGLLEGIERPYVDALIEKRCGALIRQYF